MSLKHAIIRAFDKKKRLERKDEHGNWKYPMYWLIDLHDVIIPGTYTRNNDGKALNPGAEEVLRWLTRRENMCPILWTSSHQDAINEIVKWVSDYGIKFTYVNENPEVKPNGLIDTTIKPYFDMLLDDKAGFDGETDWIEIKNALIEIGEWEK